jgi:hypothetical protein
MADDETSPGVLQRAIEQLLRPLVRLLLRHAVPFAAFEEMAKRVYVDAALNDFAIPDRKASASRVAVLTGLTRKEVQRLRSAPEEREGSGLSERYNRAARVLTGWVRDADFRDSKGVPRELEIDGEAGFAALVRRYSGDMPARAVLDELLRVGAVEQHDDARLRLVTRAFVPQRSQADKIGILGHDVADLIATIDHNLQHGATDPRFQRKVMYHSIPTSALPAFRKVSAADAQALLEKLDRWLAARDLDDPAGAEPLPRARVGLGIYYFEEGLEEPRREGVLP